MSALPRAFNSLTRAKFFSMIKWMCNHVVWRRTVSWPLGCTSGTRLYLEECSRLRAMTIASRESVTIQYPTCSPREDSSGTIATTRSRWVKGQSKTSQIPFRHPDQANHSLSRYPRSVKTSRLIRLNRWSAKSLKRLFFHHLPRLMLTPSSSMTHTFSHAMTIGTRNICKQVSQILRSLWK